MSTPMFDIPEHQMMPVNENGQGPVPDQEAARFVCWCGKDGCIDFLLSWVRYNRSIA